MMTNANFAAQKYAISEVATDIHGAKSAHGFRAVAGAAER
jgi:hypothetical protein